MFLQRKGEPEKAMECLQRALALDRTRIRCHYVMALCLRDLGREEVAEERLAIWKREDAAAREARDQALERARARTAPPAPAGPGVEGKPPAEERDRKPEGGSKDGD